MIVIIATALEEAIVWVKPSLRWGVISSMESQVPLEEDRKIGFFVHVVESLAVIGSAGSQYTARRQIHFLKARLWLVQQAAHQGSIPTWVIKESIKELISM